MGRVSLPTRSLLTWQTIVLLFTMSAHFEEEQLKASYTGGE
jgi:hypothetical protein